MDLSLIKHLSPYCEIIYLLDIPPYHHKSTALNIENGYPNNGIFKADIYCELSGWEEYIESERFYVINRTSKMKLSPTNIWLQKTITNFISEVNPDLVHIANFVDIDYLLPMLKFRKRMLVTIHDPISHSGEYSWRKMFTRNMNYTLIKNVVILNKNQLEIFRKNTNKYHLKNIFVSSLGIYEYLNKYKNGTKKTNKKFNFLFFGRVSPYKGIDLLLKAFSDIENQHANVKLIVAGSGEYWFDISTYKQYENIEIINRYIPNQELVALIEQSSVVVCPYKDATQSGVVMSAFAFHKPIIATRTGGLPEMITDGETGYLVTANDAEALKNQMIYVLEHKEELNAITENIRKKYTSKNESWTMICQRLFENYKKILSRTHINSI